MIIIPLLIIFRAWKFYRGYEYLTSPPGKPRRTRFPCRCPIAAKFWLLFPRQQSRLMPQVGSTASANPRRKDSEYPSTRRRVLNSCLHLDTINMVPLSFLTFEFDVCCPVQLIQPPNPSLSLVLSTGGLAPDVATLRKWQRNPRQFATP